MSHQLQFLQAFSLSVALSSTHFLFFLSLGCFLLILTFLVLRRCLALVLLPPRVAFYVALSKLDTWLVVLVVASLPMMSSSSFVFAWIISERVFLRLLHIVEYPKL